MGYRLCKDRFCSGKVRKIKNGEIKHYVRYTYESKKALYDIDIEENGTYKFYVNLIEIEHPKTCHKAIIKHFNLTSIKI